jgi:hypothetical protein
MVRPESVPRVHFLSLDDRSAESGMRPAAGNVAFVLKAEADCRWQSMQWQW